VLGQGPFGRPNLAALAGADALVISPALFNSSAVFFAPTVVALGTQTIQPLLFTSSAVFFGISVTGANEIIPETFVSHALFFAPTIVHQVTPDLLVEQARFPVPTVSVQAPQIVTPALFSDSALFFVPLVDLFIKDVKPGLFVDSAQFFQPTVIRVDKEPTYDYPIGRGLDSDYGIRESMTFYKQRLVLGHRYGRRR
jgi:hypothetical protein